MGWGCKLVLRSGKAPVRRSGSLCRITRLPGGAAYTVGSNADVGHQIRYKAWRMMKAVWQRSLSIWRYWHRNKEHLCLIRLTQGRRINERLWSPSVSWISWRVGGRLWIHPGQIQQYSSLNWPAYQLALPIKLQRNRASAFIVGTFLILSLGVHGMAYALCLIWSVPVYLLLPFMVRFDCLGALRYSFTVQKPLQFNCISNIAKS